MIQNKFIYAFINIDLKYIYIYIYIYVYTFHITLSINKYSEIFLEVYHILDHEIFIIFLYLYLIDVRIFLYSN